MELDEHMLLKEKSAFQWTWWGPRPKEIISSFTVVLPFDTITWALILVAVAAICLLTTLLSSRTLGLRAVRGNLLILEPA